MWIRLGHVVLPFLLLPDSVFARKLNHGANDEEELARRFLSPKASKKSSSPSLQPSMGPSVTPNDSCSSGCPDPFCAADPVTDWTLVAWMSPEGAGMHGSNLNLQAAGDFNVAAAEADYRDVLATDPDWKIDFTAEENAGLTEILFLTADETHWARASYKRFQYLTSTPAAQTQQPNVLWDRCIENGRLVDQVMGNILTRSVAGASSTPEDPWVSVADGDHSDGIEQGLIFWGEAEFTSDARHQALRITNGGVLVFVR